LQLPRPRDLEQEAIRVRHVAFDLEPLLLVETPFADREEPHLLLREQRLLLAIERRVLALRERGQVGRARVRQDTWLVAFEHDVDEAIEILELLTLARVQGGEEGVVALLAVGLEELRPLLPD